MGDAQVGSNAISMRWRIYRRQLIFVLYSVFSGGIFATTAMWRVMYGFGNDWIESAAVGLVIGGIFGLILSPFFMGLLYKKNAYHVLLAVVIPTWCVSMISNDPLISLSLTVLCYLVASMVASAKLSNLELYLSNAARVCNRCSYELHGIPNDQRCPECGWCNNADAGPLNTANPCKKCGFINKNPYVGSCPACGAKRSTQVDGSDRPYGRDDN